MLAKSSLLSHESLTASDLSSQQQSAENHPVIRTLYDHADEITCLSFHPFEPILASGNLLLIILFKTNRTFSSYFDLYISDSK